MTYGTSLRYLNLTIQLADKRVLLYKKRNGGSPQWAITVEQFLTTMEDPLVEANKILWNKFGVNACDYSDEFAEIKRLPSFDIVPNRRIFPFIMKLASNFAFQAKVDDHFVAMDWYSILDDILKKSTNMGAGQWPEHTPTAVLVAKELHLRGVFN